MRDVFVLASRRLPVLAFMFTLLASHLAVVQASSSSAEEAIKAKIEAETKAYYDANLGALKSGWVEDERASRIVVSRNGYNNISGWSKIADWYTEGLSQPRSWSNPHFSNSGYVVTIKDNMAHVEYEQTSRVTVDGKEETSRSREVRTLVNEGGSWKFLSMITVGKDSYDDSFEAQEYSMNAIGHRMMQQGKAEQAVEVFKLNTQLYPQSANAFDSLAEAYRAAGKKDAAIQNYQRSLELNRQNKNAEKKLSELKAE